MTGEAQLFDQTTAALAAARAYADAALAALRARVCGDGKVVATLLEREQRAAHGYAWIEATVAARAALGRWAEAGRARGAAGAAEADVVVIGFGEYLAQLVGGLPMGPNEVVRPADLGWRSLPPGWRPIRRW